MSAIFFRFSQAGFGAVGPRPVKDDVRLVRLEAVLESREFLEQRGRCLQPVVARCFDGDHGELGGDHRCDRLRVIDGAPATIVYDRTKTVIRRHVGPGKAVQLHDNGKYDFRSAGKSELDKSLPAEATDPASCGVLHSR